MKIGQYLTKLCVDYVGLLFLAHPVFGVVSQMECDPRLRLSQSSVAESDTDLFVSTM